jgi:hypothetical protein
MSSLPIAAPKLALDQAFDFSEGVCAARLADYCLADEHQ